MAHDRNASSSPRQSTALTSSQATTPAESRRVSLDMGWELARANTHTVRDLAAQPEHPDQIASLDLKWQPAMVPGTAAQALRAAKEWDFNTPTGREHIDFDDDDWWYRCHFSWPSVTSSVTLCCAGLATIADVWLNGTHILRSDNMYLAHEIDVTPFLQNANVLYIRFASLKAALGVKRPRPAWRTRLVEQQQLRWFRTTLLGRMPGWSASPQPVGPWRPITLEIRDSLEVVTTDIRTRVETRETSHHDGIVDVNIRVKLPASATEQTKARATKHSAASTTLHAATLTVGTTNAIFTCTPDGDTVLIQGTLRLTDVDLWWPHTHGPQPRYPATLNITYDANGTLHHTTIDCGQLAFRTVDLDTTDGNFTFSINGRSIFCRGACWSPIDSVRLDATTEQYRHALTLARDAGMNMLRVGGTMTYESNTFYDLCDELGILVWQDFMFANMDYPFADATFANTIQTEVAQFLHRTQTRACIALHCGNSEIEQQTAMLGLPRERWSGPFFQDTLPTWCRDRRPDVPYWPSSPSGGTFPFHANAGDTHYFGFGPYLRPFDDVRTSHVRFASETLAFANVPDLQTIDLIPGGQNGAGHHPAWKAGVPRDNGASWDFEDVRDFYVEYFFRTPAAQLRYSDPERYLALGRAASSEAISRTIAEWRRAGSTCQGALIWFYHDLRPGAGWGLLDATSRPKAAYYAFKRAARPLSLSLADEGLNGIYLSLINETTSSITANLRLALYRKGELPIVITDRPITLASNETRELHADAILDGFCDLSYAYRFGPPNHDLVVATLTDQASGAFLDDAFFFPIGLPADQHLDVGLQAEAILGADGGYYLKLQSQRFAQNIALDIADFQPDDNYFHLAPGVERIIPLRPSQRPSGTAATETNSPSASSSLRRPSGTALPLNALTATRILVR